jgi:hypothetical protein
MAGLAVGAKYSKMEIYILLFGCQIQHWLLSMHTSFVGNIFSHLWETNMVFRQNLVSQPILRDVHSK